MFTFLGTPLPWTIPNANLSHEENIPVQVNETYNVTCKDGLEIYNQNTDSFVGGQNEQLRSVTVKNVQGNLLIIGRNLDILRDKLICKQGTSSIAFLILLLNINPL